MRGRALPAAALAAVAFLLVAGHAGGAAAAGSGSVTVGPTGLTGGGQVSPGARISAGYDLAFTGAHASTTVHVAGATATLSLRCKQNEAPAGQLVIPLADRPSAIAAGDIGWHATSGQRDPAGYQGSGSVPDLCGGRQAWVDAHGSLGVTFAATLESGDTHDAIQIRFHAVDASATCGDPTQNPSPGSSACDAPWSAAGATTAALTPGSSATTGTTTPPPTSAPGHTAPGTGATAPHTGSAHSSGVAGVASHPPAGAGGGPLHLSVPAVATPIRPAFISGELPLSVVLAPTGGSHRSIASPLQGLPGAVVRSLFSELPLNWFVLIAGADVLLLMALVVRRRRAQHYGGLSDVHGE